MVKIFFKIIILILLISGSANAGIILNPADTVVKRDTINKKQEIFHDTNSETVIIFNDSKLAPQNVRMIFNELFRQYLTIKDALVYNDAYNAKRNTLKLLEDMRSKTNDIELLIRDVRWAFFINNYDNIRNKVEAADFISQQRFLFNEITNGIQNFIKQFGLYNKTIYLMKSTAESKYGNNEWLSDSKDEKNPYLGLMNDTIYVKVKEIWKFN
jgi:hypothetical protein